MLTRQAVGMLESMTIPGLLPSPHWQAFVVCFPTPLPSPMHSTPMNSHQQQQQQSQQQQQQHSPAPALSLVGIAAASTFVHTRNHLQLFRTESRLATIILGHLKLLGNSQFFHITTLSATTTNGHSQ